MPRIKIPKFLLRADTAYGPIFTPLKMAIPDAADQEPTTNGWHEFRAGQPVPVDDRPMERTRNPDFDIANIVSHIGSAVPDEAMANGALSTRELMEHHARDIRAAYQAAVGAVIEVGRRLARAKKELGKHGLWEQFIREHLPWKPRTVRALMRIGSYSPFQNGDIVAGLPTDQRCLDELARLPPSDFFSLFDAHPNLSRLPRDAIGALVRERLGQTAKPRAAVQTRPRLSESADGLANVIDQVDRLVKLLGQVRAIELASGARRTLRRHVKTLADAATTCLANIDADSDAQGLSLKSTAPAKARRK